MSLPTHIGAYNDCLDHFDRALTTKRGLRIQFESEPTAKYFQMRMVQARALQRDENRRIYDRSNPLWGRSEFDKFQVKRPVEDVDGHWWVYIVPNEAMVMATEELE